MTKQVRNILIAGGTHGNEMTGIHLVRNWLNDPSELQYSTLKVNLLLANPQAIAQCRRYVDFDLNRAFQKELLDAQLPNTNAEVLRAREINELFGPKGENSPCDLCIDIHNSTAQMGQCLIVNRLDDCTRFILAHLVFWGADQGFRILYQPEDPSPYLPSIAQRDITLELGPQAHGTLKASIMLRAQKTVKRILALLEVWNLGYQELPSVEVEFFEQVGTLDYPRLADGALAGMIHPSLEGKDFAQVKPGDPIFMDWKGNSIAWDGQDSIWPCFIGEAAYQEKRIAMSLLRRKVEIWK